MNHWNEVPVIEKTENSLDEWNKIRDLFPICFVDVWVSKNKKTKKKAWFDAPNRRWVASAYDIWGSEVKVLDVIAWTEIKSNPIEKQLKEHEEGKWDWETDEEIKNDAERK